MKWQTPSAVIVMLALSACGLTSQGDSFRSTVADKGREAAAKGLEDAEWWICRASPIGAVRDRYGRSEALAEAWNALCAGEGGVNIIEPRP